MGNHQIWNRPHNGSQIDELADSIMNEMNGIQEINAERFANYPAIRGICANGAQAVWTAKGTGNAGWENIPRQEGVNPNQQRRSSWKSPVTDAEYDVAWSEELGGQNPTEILQTKRRVHNVLTRHHSMLGDWIFSAIDVFANQDILRSYVFAVYPSEGVDDTLWTRIVPVNGTYTLTLTPYEADNANLPRGNEWIDAEEGTIALNNQRIIRAVFGRGGNHHLMGMWERNGILTLRSDVVSRNCGNFTFALYSLRSVSFQSDDWTLMNWLP